MYISVMMFFRAWIAVNVGISLMQNVGNWQIFNLNHSNVKFNHAICYVTECLISFLLRVLLGGSYHPPLHQDTTETLKTLLPTTL